MKRDLWDAVHKCTKCSSLMKKRNLVVESINVRGWECIKCKDTVLHPKDAQKMLLLSKLKRGLSVKVGELGKSLIVRIPKEVVNLYNLSKGEQITMRAEGNNRIELEVPL